MVGSWTEPDASSACRGRVGHEHVVDRQDSRRRIADGKTPSVKALASELACGSSYSGAHVVTLCTCLHVDVDGCNTPSITQP
jgi:hypothetical protein